MTSPSISSYLPSWFLVRDYGAVGDGNKPDDFAIQATMNAASRNGGGLVMLSKGTYRLDNSLTWSGLTNVCVWLDVGCELTGTGTLPAATGTNNSIFDLRSGAPSGSGAAGYPLGTTGITGATDASRYAGGTVNGAPVTGTFNVGDFIVDQSGSIWICQTAGSPGTWYQLAANQYPGAPVTGVSATGPILSSGSTNPTISLDSTAAITQTNILTGTAIKATGETGGATAGGRFVGATLNGKPTTGTYLKGDFVVDQSGSIWICTTGGVDTGASWSQLSAAISGAPVTGVTATAPLAATGTATAPIIGLPATNAITQTAAIQGTTLKASGLAGSDATAAGRFIGAKTNGKPLVGTFTVGDFAIDQTGSIWVCTTGGVNTAAVWAQLSSALAGGAPVTGVSASSPLSSTGTTTPTISLDPNAAISQNNTITGKVLAVNGASGAVSPTRYVGGTPNVAPTSGTWQAGDFVVTQTGKIYVCTAAGTPGTWTQVGGLSGVTSVSVNSPLTVAGTATAPIINLPAASAITQLAAIQGTTLKASGITGATAATRYAGGTASGAPTIGTFAVGDFVVTQDAKIYVCTTAGSPGTWTQVSGPTTAQTLNVIQRQVVSSVATVTFAAIPQTYKNIRLEWNGHAEFVHRGRKRHHVVEWWYRALHQRVQGSGVIQHNNDDLGIDAAHVGQHNSDRHNGR
jgi:hypothetical protein